MTIAELAVNQRRNAPYRLVAGLALWMLAFQLVLAAPFSSDGIVLDIPSGFEGPLMQSTVGGRVFGYSKQSLAPDIRTLLQITVLDHESGATHRTLTKEELAQGSEKYLRDFLIGIERRRTEFKKGNVLHLLLGGNPASRVSWQGRARGVAANGILYYVIANGRIVLFHAQDAGNEATSNMREAIKSIEAVQVR